MTLDEGYVSTRELMERTEAEDARLARADYEEQRLIESPEAEEARWANRFRQSAAERPGVVYDDKPGIDRRMFAVDGDVA
jgi:hypothetical protein